MCTLMIFAAFGLAAGIPQAYFYQNPSPNGHNGYFNNGRPNLNTHQTSLHTAAPVIVGTTSPNTYVAPPKVLQNLPHSYYGAPPPPVRQGALLSHPAGIINNAPILQPPNNYISSHSNIGGLRQGFGNNFAASQTTGTAQAFGNNFGASQNFLGAQTHSSNLIAPRIENNNNQGLSNYAAVNTLAQGPTQAPLVTKQIYVHTAPEDPEDVAQLNAHTSFGPARKHYRIIFIKVPSQSARNAALSLAQVQNQEKTIIYVLSKKTDPSEIQSAIQSASVQHNKPEVFFIKYKTKEEAVQAQQQIQAQYDALGGISHASKELISPVTSIGGANRQNKSQGVAITGSATLVGTH